MSAIAEFELLCEHSSLPQNSFEEILCASILVLIKDLCPYETHIFDDMHARQTVCLHQDGEYEGLL